MSDSEDYEREKMPTRMKIVQCAVNLFAAKGFTETSIRELATAVGFQGSAIYHHFPSKNAILEYILKDYAANSFGPVTKPAMKSKLMQNPTADGILSCMLLKFPVGREEYFAKVLCVVLQEQHRNPIFSDFIRKIILNAERQIRFAFEILQEMDVFHQDADPDYWMKVFSSLLYTYSSRFVLGIGDNSPDYVGKDMVEMLRTTFDLMMQHCAATNDGDEL